MGAICKNEQSASMEITMKKEQIPAFVKEILEAGATLWAAGDDVYFFGDLEATEHEAAEIAARADAVCQRYGARDHLQSEIAQHLKALGLEIKVDKTCHVSGWIDRAQSAPMPEPHQRKFAS